MIKKSLSYDRYRELVYWARQYKDHLPHDKRIVNAAIKDSLARRYGAGAEAREAKRLAAKEIKKSICDGVPLTGLDLPYSDRQIKRIRSEVYGRIDDARRADAEKLNSLD